jgi:hypothetical protein
MIERMVHLATNQPMINMANEEIQNEVLEQMTVWNSGGGMSVLARNETSDDYVERRIRILMFAIYRITFCSH